MASALAIPGPGPTTTSSTTPPRIVRLWRDTTRVEQLARLRSLELQPGDDFGQQAWELAHEQWRNLPDHARIDLPSPHVFGRVLGLFRTGATLKTGKLLQLELSAEEIAELLGYSKTTIEAALRWLDAGPIDYLGDQLARGLGVIHRGRRTAWAFLQGKMQRGYRTSKTVLTGIGRLLLGLHDRYDERKAEKRAARWRRHTGISTTPPATTIDPPTERQHIQGIGTDGGGQGAEPFAAPPDIGREWLRKIQSSF